MKRLESSLKVIYKIVKRDWQFNWLIRCERKQNWLVITMPHYHLEFGPEYRLLQYRDLVSSLAINKSHIILILTFHLLFFAYPVYVSKNIPIFWKFIVNRKKKVLLTTLIIKISFMISDLYKCWCTKTYILSTWNHFRLCYRLIYDKF